MRRFFIIVGILLLVLFFTACKTKNVEHSNRPVLHFVGDMEIISEKIVARAKITRTEDCTQIDITMPEGLNGLQIAYSRPQNSISQNGLSYKTDGLIFPRESEMSLLFEIFEFMESATDEEPFFKDHSEMAFIGKISSGKFELRANRNDGLITEIKIDDKITIKFSNQAAL